MTKERYQEILHLKKQNDHTARTEFEKQSTLLYHITSTYYIPNFIESSTSAILTYILSQHIYIPSNLIPFNLSVKEYIEFMHIWEAEHPIKRMESYNNSNCIR